MGIPRRQWRVQTLRCLSVSCGTTAFTLRPTSRRLVALLAVLGATPRSEAAGLLWPDISEQRAHANLRTAIWRTRSDAAGLLADEDTHVISLACAHSDFQDVRDWAWRALRGVDPWTPIPSGANDELLPTMEEEWLTLPREELHLLQTSALEAVGQRLMLAGKLGEAAGVTAAVLRRDPIRESANRLLMEIHLRQGNQWDALRIFRRYETALRRELRVAPSPALTALVAELLNARKHSDARE